jgi:hypothetical protein
MHEPHGSMDPHARAPATPPQRGSPLDTDFRQLMRELERLDVSADDPLARDIRRTLLRLAELRVQMQAVQQETAAILTRARALHRDD